MIDISEVLNVVARMRDVSSAKNEVAVVSALSSVISLLKAYEAGDTDSMHQIGVAVTAEVPFVVDK
jgi:hypothetical protein